MPEEVILATTGHGGLQLRRDELQLEAAAAERAALEKARAEQRDRASLDHMRSACALLYLDRGWIVKPPHKK